MIAQTGSLLIVDDDGDIRESMAEYLRDRGFRTETSDCCGDAITRLGERSFEVVVCDVNLPDRDGFHFLEWATRNAPTTAVILLTGYGSIESAVDAMRTGAFDYLTKPVIDDELDGSIRRALSGVSAPPTVDLAGRDSQEKRALLGRDPRMQQLFELIEAVAPTRTTALILGESGTGKTLTARAVHDLSDRRGRPFVEVSCGALSETLLESELFGHVTGAFTGATGDRAGRFRQADGGTLFLDEIATASPALQVRLLRVLQEQRFEPVGSTRTEQVDVRLIVASNQDLESLVREGSFREDLYYRINVITLMQPPLRERVSDIPLLVAAYRQQFSEETKRLVTGVDERAMRLLCHYDWPGNVRELVNVVERAVVLCPGERIGCDDLPEAVRRVGSADPTTGASNRLKSALAEPERRLILDTLEAHGWNRQRTAGALGINRTTLYKKMKRFGIAVPQH